jgi:hypothetical protein
MTFVALCYAEAVAKTHEGRACASSPRHVLKSLLPRLGPGSNQLSAKLVAFQHMAHLTPAITLAWVALNALI